MKMSKKEYTYNNGRKGQGSAVSRIDKFLVSQELEAIGGQGGDDVLPSHGVKPT
jgi:hypothetical protein